MNRPLDPQYTSLILNLITRPFDHTKAFSLGLVNGDGELIKKPSNQNEKEAYTPLHQLAFGVKRILDSFPGSSSKVKQLAVALNFIKKRYVPEQFKESVDLNPFLKELLLVVENDICLPEEEVLVEKYLKEDGEVVGEPPANNTQNISAHTPVIDRLFRRPKKKESTDGNDSD
jgi:hypothetical protein